MGKRLCITRRLKCHTNGTMETDLVAVELFFYRMANTITVAQAKEY
jgi:hypothetical protein